MSGITVEIKTVTNKVHSVEISGSDSVASLKQKLNDSTGTPIVQQDLLFSVPKGTSGARLVQYLLLSKWLRMEQQLDPALRSAMVELPLKRFKDKNTIDEVQAAQNGSAELSVVRGFLILNLQPPVNQVFVKLHEVGCKTITIALAR